MSTRLPALPPEVDVDRFKGRARALACVQRGRLSRRDIEQLFWACAPGLVDELRGKGTFEAACEKLRGFYFPALLAIINEDLLGKPIVEGPALAVVHSVAVDGVTLCYRCHAPIGGTFFATDGKLMHFECWAEGLTASPPRR